MPTNTEKKSNPTATPQAEIPRFNRQFLTPMQRDQIIMGTAYGNVMDTALDFMALVDIRDRALRYIESKGLMDEFVEKYQIDKLRQARV